MITTEQAFLDFLRENGFDCPRIEHPAVFTCEEADSHRPPAELTNGETVTSTKNLFICDKKGRRFFLVVTSCEKSVNLQALAPKLGVAHLRFASEEKLFNMLGVTRGSVTMMGLVNDTQKQVELWIDEEIWQGKFFQSHPLVNTATLILSRDELSRFFALTGYEIHLYTNLI